jgi:hypothetical protein
MDISTIKEDVQKKKKKMKVPQLKILLVYIRNVEM